MSLGTGFRQGAGRHNVARCWLLIFSLVLISAQLQAQNGWTRKADMLTGRVGATAAVVGGKIYVIGGERGNVHLATNEVYDPATNSWATLKPMLTARSFPFFGVVRDTIYVLGGTNAGYTVTTAKVEAYDRVTNTWTDKADMSLPRLGPNAAVVDNIMYLIAGSFNRTECQAYCASPNACQIRRSIPDSLGQKGGLSVTAHNGIVYAFGGSNYPPWSPLSQASAYDPQSDTWTGRSPMPTARYGLLTCLLRDKIYAMGGGQSENRTLATVEVYDPALNSWASLPLMPRALVFLSGAVVNSKIYVIGGTPDWASSSAELWEYDPLATIVENKTIRPERFVLLQNHPNPFNPTTTIRYELPKAMHVTLTVFDMLGREVATLLNAVEEPGYKSVEWNAAGRASGVYLYRMTAGEYSACRKMIVMR